MKRFAVLALLAAVAGAQAGEVPAASSAKPAPDGFLLVTDESLTLPSVFRLEASDKTFERALTRWAKSAGWDVSWELDAKYSIGYPANFGTDFIKAVDRLVTSLNASGVRAHSRVYLDNKVVRIVHKESQQ